MNYDVIYSHSGVKNSIIPKKSEILRYLGQRDGGSDELLAMIDTHLPRLMDACVPSGSFVLKRPEVKGGEVVIDGVTYPTLQLAKNLGDCHSCIVFALTIGASANRMCESLSSKPGQAYIVSAIGTAIIESYADSFNKEIKEYFEKSNMYLRPRFSPGYGDFDLKNQSHIMAMTDASRRCGIYLTKALMLTPTKSVTGIIGISNTNRKCPVSGCEMCDKTDCMSRRNTVEVVK